MNSILKELVKTSQNTPVNKLYTLKEWMMGFGVHLFNYSGSLNKRTDKITFDAFKEEIDNCSEFSITEYKLWR